MPHVTGLTWLSLKWLAICPELDWMHVISCRISTILTIRYLYTAAAVYCSHGMVPSKHLLKRKKKKNLAEGCRQQKGNIHCMKYLKFRLIGMFLLVQFSAMEIMAETECFGIQVYNTTSVSGNCYIFRMFMRKIPCSFPFIAKGRGLCHWHCESISRLGERVALTLWPCWDTLNPFLKRLWSFKITFTLPWMETSPKKSSCWWIVLMKKSLASNVPFLHS